MRRAVACRVATRPWELEQVHRLNRDVFAVEVGQHTADGELLVDRFHDENTYLVAVEDRQVIGMLAVRDRRPFSLDEKLPELDRYLPPGRKICEVRLLAIARDRRHGMILPQLLRALWRLGRRRAYDVAVLSAYPARVPLYERLGCTSFGPRVLRDGFEFQPMMATRERFAAALPRFSRETRKERPAPQLNFLPGPVRIAEATRRAFAAAAISHRSPAFDDRLARCKARLRAATGAQRVEILLGSGTLANDVVAAQLGLLPGHGLVLSNGEFGERLAAQARRHRLDHHVLCTEWGEPLPLAAIAQELDVTPCTWLWFAHCETSTGVLNDLGALRALCAERGVRVAADCISSLGTVPVDLTAVHLATGVSGKGLRSFPGLAFVFHDHAVEPQPERLPSYLDLGLWAKAGGVPFTHSSNLLAGLAYALEDLDIEARCATVLAASRFLRPRLVALGFDILADQTHASPAVFTLTLPATLDSRAAGDALRGRGVLVSYESAYLLERNWIQICLMGETRRSAIAALLAELASVRPSASVPDSFA